MTWRGAVGAGFLSGACCTLPAMGAVLGLGAASPLGFLKPIQPLLAGGAVVMLGLAWHRRLQAGRECPCPAMSDGTPGRRPSTWGLSAVSALVLASAAYPWYGPALFTPVPSVAHANMEGGPATAAESRTVHRLVVQGMTCDSCRAAVKAALGQVRGVLGVDVDLETGLTVVAADAALDPGLEALVAAIRAAGYSVVG